MDFLCSPVAHVFDVAMRRPTITASQTLFIGFSSMKNTSRAMQELNTREMGV